MSKALTHIALNVRDRAASEAFYRDWAGMVNATPNQDHAAPWLSTPGQEGRFALVLVPGAKAAHRQDSSDETHIGIIMESEAALDALYVRAQREGNVHSPLHEGAQSGRRSFSVLDPDGNVVQFTWKRHAPAPLARTFNSVTLHVHDLQDSEEFFTKWGGMKLLGHPHNGDMSRLASPGYEDTFSLILRGNAQAPYMRDDDDISHLGFAVGMTPSSWTCLTGPRRQISNTGTCKATLAGRDAVQCEGPGRAYRGVQRRPAAGRPAGGDSAMSLTLPAAKEERWKYTDIAGAVRKLAVDEAPSAPLIRAEASPLVKSLPSGKGLQIDVPAGQVVRSRSGFRFRALTAMCPSRPLPSGWAKTRRRR